MENLTVGDVHKADREGPMQGLEGTATIAQSQRIFVPPSIVSAGRRRGRPPGSKNGENVAMPMGRNFTPHVVSVNRGEDVLEKILSFSQKGSWRVTILSANGSLYSVAICHPGSPNSMHYEGCFYMISVSGYVDVTESEGVQSSISIVFSGIDGRVYGGEVVGPLMAASPVQVVVGTYTLECHRKRRKTNVDKPSAITLPSTSGKSSLPHASGEQETGVTPRPIFIKPEPEELD